MIELVIVMAIMLILITLAIPKFVGAVRHAREAALKEDLQTVRDCHRILHNGQAEGPAVTRAI